MPSICEPFFDGPTWDQGEDLLACGKVMSIIKQPHTYTAQIQDGALLHISIQFHPLNMSCDCLIAAQGKHCMHMAALCHLYEQDHEELAMIQRNHRPWHCEMADILNEMDEVINLEAFLSRLHSYLIKPIHHMKNLNDSFADYLDLYAYLLDTPIKSRPWQRLLRECITQLANIRNYGRNLQVTKETQMLMFYHEEADMALLYVLDDFHYHPLNSRVLFTYFNDPKDMICLSDYIRKIKYTHNTEFVQFCFTLMQKFAVSETDLAAFCIIHTDVKEPRRWLIDYYRRNKQMDEGIHFLSDYCLHKGTEHDIAEEQMELLLFYAEAQKHAALEQYYPLVLHADGLDKIELFVRLRQVMNPTQWQKWGRIWMLDYMKQLDESAQLELIKATKCADLLLSRLLPCAKEIRIVPYYELLKQYDQGILCHLIAVQLEELIQKNADVEHIINHVSGCFPAGQLEIGMLKSILIQLRWKLEKQRSTTVLLDQLEDQINVLGK